MKSQWTLVWRLKYCNSSTAGWVTLHATVYSHQLCHSGLSASFSCNDNTIFSLIQIIIYPQVQALVAASRLVFCGQHSRQWHNTIYIQFCLTDLFPRDHSSLGRITKCLQKKNFCELLLQDILQARSPITQPTVSKHWRNQCCSCKMMQYMSIFNKMSILLTWIHTPYVKKGHPTIAITLPNVDRFSKFIHH